MATVRKRGAFILGAVLLVAVGSVLPWVVLQEPLPALAAPGTLYVSSVSGDDANPCSDSSPCRTIQRAANLAVEGDEIWIATVDIGLSGAFTTSYTVTNNLGGSVQVIYLTRTLTLRGGYVYTHLLGHVWVLSFIPATVDPQGDGRGLYVTGDVTPTLELLTFRGGSAVDGGNVYVEGGQARLLGVLVEDGSATRGGGLYLKDSDALLSGIFVQDNQAVDGGGVYLEGGGAIVAGGVFQGNTAQNGGGFYLEDSGAWIAGTMVLSNTASLAGGGFYYDGPITFLPWDIPVLANSYVRHNDAQDGGGVYFRLSIAGLANNVIADNQAGGHGGGLYCWAASPQLVLNTVARNAGAEGIYLTHQPGSEWPPLPPIPSWPSLTNTIVVSHSVGVYVDSTGWPFPLENRATLRGTLWWGNGSDTAGPGEVDIGSTNLYDHPRFTCMGDPPACLLPYHLEDTSPAVDAGVDIAIDLPWLDYVVDIDGQMRPSGAGYDIGADEVPQASSVWLQPPLSLQVAGAGETITHTHQLINSGLSADTYSLTLSSSRGWSSLATAVPISLDPQTRTTVSVRVSVPATATAGMTETGYLTATSWGNPDIQAYALESTTVMTTGWCDLVVGKRADADSVAPGEAVRFTLVLTNAGPFSGTLEVALSDLAFPLAAVEAITAPANCDVSVSLGFVSCTLALPAGTPPIATSLDIVMTTTAAYSGSLVNTAWATAAVPDPDERNNAVQVEVEVVVPTGPGFRVYLPLIMRMYAP